MSQKYYDYIFLPIPALKYRNYFSTKRLFNLQLGY